MTRNLTQGSNPDTMSIRPETVVNPVGGDRCKSHQIAQQHGSGDQ